MQATMRAACDGSSTTARGKWRGAIRHAPDGTMTEFEFTLKFRLPDADADPVAWVDALAAAGCTRQNIRKLMLVNAATFPPAVHEGASSLWHLQPVLAWFREYQKRPVDPVLLDVADVAMNVNIANAARRVEGDAMQRKIRPLFR